MKKLQIMLLSLMFTFCTQQEKFSDNELYELITYTYPYIAGFSSINGLAYSGSEGLGTGGWNEIYKPTKLSDHFAVSLPTPNNDTFYVFATIDVSIEPVIVTYPKFSSKYVSLEAVAYDHSIMVPLASSQGDFQKETKVLYYNADTENYKEFDSEGIDKIVKVNGKHFIAFLRIMPHFQEPKRFTNILQKIQDVNLQTYSEYKGIAPLKQNDINIPQVYKEVEIYQKNFFEVMQFIVNDLSFTKKIAIDKKMLKVVKNFGIEKGKIYDPSLYPQLDKKRLEELVLKLRDTERTKIKTIPRERYYDFFLPNEKMTIENLVLETVGGPLGLPADEVIYPEILTEDGEDLNAQYEYVISMTAEELPPVYAFWSITIYDKNSSLFLTNDQFKYSVGENAGMKLDDKGGIDIYISSEKPEGVPEENWLPVPRGEYSVVPRLRLYAPKKQAREWEAPVARKL